MTGALPPTSCQPAPTPRSMTIGELLQQGTSLLSAAGITNAAQEASWLLEFVLKASRLDLQLMRGVPAADDVTETALTLFRRRASREPLQYLLGSQEFCGLDFLVTPDVLIPRPESELLVDVVCAESRRWPEPLIADIGTGSGCLAIALARRLPAARVYAVDVSPAALEVAQRNAVAHGVASRVVFLLGDLLSPLEALNMPGQWTAIVANPPYIPDVELSRLQPEVAWHEPRIALAGGPDGLLVHRRLLAAAAPLLEAGGALILEVGLGQAEPLCHLAEREENYYNIRTIRDAAGIDRIVCLHARRDELTSSGSNGESHPAV